MTERIYLNDLVEKVIPYNKIVIPADIHQFNESREKIESLIRYTLVSKNVADLYSKKEFENLFYEIAICMSEALNNAIRHGNKEKGSVDVYLFCNKNLFYVAIKDNGEGFDLSKINNCTKDENLLKNCGRGIHICKCLMDDIYNQRNPHVLYIAKELKEKKE